MENAGFVEGGGSVNYDVSARTVLEISPVEVASYNIERVTSILSSLRGEKYRLVRWIGFGGLLRIGVRKKLNDDFSLWLLRILDTDKMTLRTSRATVLSISGEDMNLVLGIPCVGVEVDKESTVQPGVMQAIRHKLSLDISEDSITLPFLEEIVTRDYGPVMSHKEEEAFKIAFVLYTMTTLLSAEGLHPGIRLCLLNYLVDTSNIRKVNWAGYVLQVIKEAALGVQHELSSGNLKFVVSGCMLALQIFYIDNMDFGPDSLIHGHVPRVSAYAQVDLDKLITKDLDDAVPGLFKTYGLTKARNDADVMYSRRSSRGVNIHDKCNEKMDNILSKYFKSCEDFRSKCIKDSEHFMQNMTQQHCVDNASSHDEATYSSNNNIFGSFISKLPLVPPLPDVTSSFRSIMPDVSLDAQCNPHKRYKRCAVRSKKKRRLGEGVETPLTAALAGETSNIVSSTGEISVIVPEQHKQTIIPRQPSSTLFPRLKMRCNRLVSASHPNEHLNCPDQAEADSDPKPYKAEFTIDHYVKPDSPLATISPEGCSVDVQNVANPESYNHLAIVVYDIVASAERCRASVASIDPSMAPRKVSGEPDYTDSPFEAGYNHILPDRKKSRGLYKLVDPGTNLELDRIWFRHRSPWLIEISGRSLITQFKRGGTFSEDLADAICRMHTELDDSMFGPGRKRFRHYLPARFASMVLAGGDFLHSKQIRDAFVGEHLKYDVEHCRHIIAPVPTSSGYSCYIWDISARDLLVLDPMLMNGDEVRATNRHKKNMDALSNALVKCTQSFFDGWSLKDGEWLQGVETTEYGGRCRWNNSGLYTMHYARWYAGIGLEKRISDVELGEIRADMFYQLLNMIGNAGDLPSLFWTMR